MAKEEATKKEEVTQKSEPTQPETGEGFSVAKFFKGTKDELGKVVWPSRQQLISESIAVILMVSLSASVIYLIDKFFSWASGQVF